MNKFRGTWLKLTFGCLILSGSALASHNAYGQQKGGPAQEKKNEKNYNGPTSIFVFPMDMSCVCVRTRSKTSTLSSEEVTVGKDIFQVFSDKHTGREVFRVPVGSADAKWWNYGVVYEGDPNADGRPDYSWYGGDDTSDVMYIFLSRAEGYERLDVYETLKRWGRQILRTDWSDIDVAGPGEGVDDVRLVGDSHTFALEATVVYKERTYQVRVEMCDFVFSQ